MIQIRTFTYPSCDGKNNIHAQQWLPEGRPRAVVQIIHGVSEYVGRYDTFARFLADHGFAVCGQDHLGHGRTARKEDRGYFSDRGGWQLLVGDVLRLRQLQGEQFPGIPYILMGHSMGSFLARTCLIDYPGTVDGCILSGTGQESAPLVAAGKAVAELLCRLRGPRYVSRLIHAMSLGAYNNAFKPNRTAADWISRDESAVDAYIADPLCAFRPTVSLFRDMMGGLQYIGSPANLARMDRKTPVCFFSGDRDPVGAMGAGVCKVAAMFRGAGCVDAEVNLYPGGRHEILNELNRDQVYGDILSWLERHT